MTALLEPVAFGAHAPDLLHRAVIALTSRMPDNWIGLRLAILVRRLSTMRLDYPAGALDVVRWGMRLRLHPRDNGCEKNLLFTPQMYEATELAILSQDIKSIRALGREFVFIDIGANVGLFSFFVAATSGPQARILAIEPEAGNFARLEFNIRCNPGVPIRPLQIALADKAGELVVERPGADRGGARTRMMGSTAEITGQRVEARTLMTLMQDEGIDQTDALKIDVEGSEDKILLPFFRAASPSLWPRLLLIEDAGDAGATDLLSFLPKIGYALVARSRQNVMLRLPGH